MHTWTGNVCEVCVSSVVKEIDRICKFQLLNTSNSSFWQKQHWLKTTFQLWNILRTTSGFLASSTHHLDVRQLLGEKPAAAAAAASHGSVMRVAGLCWLLQQPSGKNLWNTQTSWLKPAPWITSRKGPDEVSQQAMWWKQKVPPLESCSSLSCLCSCCID